MKRHKKEVINSISVDELTEYLRNTGWFVNHSVENAKFFTHKNYDYEILVPLDYNLGDWTLRISEAISILSDCEERYEIDIIRDIKKEKQCYILTEEELKILLEKSIKWDIIDNSDWLDDDIATAMDSWYSSYENCKIDEPILYEIEKQLLSYKKG